MVDFSIGMLSEKKKENQRWNIWSEFESELQNFGQWLKAQDLKSEGLSLNALSFIVGFILWAWY